MLNLLLSRKQLKMPCSLLNQAPWSVIQQVLYLTFDSLWGKKQKKTNLSCFWFFFSSSSSSQHCNYISALQGSSQASNRQLQSDFKGMNVNYELARDNIWPPSTTWRQAPVTLMLETELKAELAEKPRKDAEEETLDFNPVSVGWTSKELCNLHILSL